MKTFNHKPEKEMSEAAATVTGIALILSAVLLYLYYS